MGQSEVMSLLKRSEKWNTTEEIANKLDVNVRIVGRALLVLVRYNEVLRKRCKKSKHFKYVYKVTQEQEGEKILEEFQEVGEENFGSKGLEK